MASFFIAEILETDKMKKKKPQKTAELCTISSFFSWLNSQHRDKISLIIYFILFYSYCKTQYLILCSSS